MTPKKSPLRQSVSAWFTTWMPTLAFFARCWSHLHRKASRRAVEVAIAAIMITQMLRLLEAVGRIGPLPFALAPPLASAPAVRLVLAGNDFYAHLWPSPWLWVVALGVGVLCGVAGLQQVVAAVMLTRARGDLRLLSDCGEDDERFWSSVDPAWLLADVRLRRVALATGMAFCATFWWVLLIHTGWPSLLWLVLFGLCCYVDDRLGDTSQAVRECRDLRRRAEREAVAVVYGPKP